MWLITGLGNPGKEYERNRHNIGFMAVDAIIHRHNFSEAGKKFKSVIFNGEIAGEKILIVKPQTYMNLSGDAVQAAASFYKIPSEQVIVLHDELDLQEGKIRVKQGGSSGGHNGLKSIDSCIGQDYWRVRLGIGHPGERDMVTNHVLGDFAKADKEWLERLMEAVSDNIELFVKGERDNFASKVSQEMKNLKQG